mmetsp:Transcript_4467/g.6646  ORF Transcript_4467/g.6646 Transcript_4467/m.6646 type:complete len:84 (+) Transcript_4467:2067-2318(+)
MSEKEIRIREEEYKKYKIIRMLAGKLGDSLQQDQIHEPTWSTRYLESPPEGVDMTKLDRIEVIQDYYETYPSFQSLLYCSLDY